jgi:hypothetical protein
MSDNARGDASRDAFFAALGRVFQEYRDVSSGYAIHNHARIAEMLGADVKSPAEIRIGGGTVTIAPGGGGDIVVGPGECVTVVFNLVTGDWECIYFMAP